MDCDTGYGLGHDTMVWRMCGEVVPEIEEPRGSLVCIKVAMLDRMSMGLAL